MEKGLRNSGISILGNIPWGMHLCYFYQTKEDMANVLIPFLKAGLENNEFCLWITSESLYENESKGKLEKTISNFSDYFNSRQIETMPPNKWCHNNGGFNSEVVINSLIYKLTQALNNGYDGLRISGDYSWLENIDQDEILLYERAIHNALADHNVIALCFYPFNRCSGVDVLNIISCHSISLIIRDGEQRLYKRVRRMKVREKHQKKNILPRDVGEDIQGIICRTDVNGIIRYIGPLFSNILGFKPQEALGSYIYNYIYQNDPDMVISFYKKALSLSSLNQFGFRRWHRDGYRVWAKPMYNVIGDDKGCTAGAMFIMQDIMARKKTVEDLQCSIKVELAGVLAASIAHDLNNILSLILGNVSLAAIYINEDNKAYVKLKNIERAVQQAKDLLGRLFILAKGGEPVKVKMFIKQLIIDVATLALSDSSVKCEFFIPDELFPVKIDEAQFTQVISNLITNASQAMSKSGRIRVRAENITIQTDGTGDYISSHVGEYVKGEYIKISIEDEGMGIPPENLQKIFDPFYTSKKKGTGLGLAICHSIIKKHGGFITVESEIGKGTIFHLYLPACLEEVLI